MKKGIIALDIDGTITAEHHTLPVSVKKYFEKLVDDGWQLIFITGRTFRWGFEVLKELNFPYYFALQNGAIILEMPSRLIIYRKYLDRSILATMDHICRYEASDYVVYLGFEFDDICYFRPKFFSPEMLKYVNERTNKIQEVWRPVESYEDMPIDTFASVKCFGKHSEAMHIAKKIEDRLGLHVPLIRDPYDEAYYVVQATHPEINKGLALKNLTPLLDHQGVIIAAGDDLNDISMLEVADIRVVMANAPESVLALADIVAPPATQEGIIQGLHEAIKRSGESL